MESTMKELLKAHNVSPSFLSVLLAAGEPPRESEEGFGNSILNEYRDGSFSLAYLYRYYEKKQEKWKLRQTGIYHGFSMQTKSNVWIVLHPGQNTIFQTRLENLVTESGSAEAIIAQPTRVHALLFISYFDNWRWFLQDKGEDFANVRPGMTVKYYQHVLIAESPSDCLPLTLALITLST